MTCSVENCDKPVHARDYCSTHYQRWEAHGDPSIVLKPYGRRAPKPPCSIDGCDGATVGRGWCGKHYQRWTKYGDPLFVKQDRTLTPEERFWPNVDKNGPVPEHRPDLGPCWVWTGGTSDGYGMFWLDGKHIQAHRVAHLWEFGPIPDGMERDHLCRNRACCRTTHLEVVTAAVNQQRGESPSGVNSRKTHCPQGHPYDAANTYINNGMRYCRACARERSRAWYNRKRSSGQ